MKTLITFIAILLIISNVKGQLITISETHQMPIVGDSIHYIDANTFGFDAAGTGPVTTKVWDFSLLMSTGTDVDFVFVDPSTLSAGDGVNFFPTANLAKRQSDANGYFYYKNTANNIDRIGAYNSATNYMIYTGGTAATEFYFPITAGGSHNSTYHGTFAPFNVGEDSVTVESGTLSISADMQGQMILPTGTFNGALRLHVIESFHLKAYIMGMAATDNIVSDDYYYWFVDTILQPLVIYGVTTIDGTAQTPVLRYQPINSPTSINEINNSDQVSVYPVPSNGNITIHIGKEFNSLNKIEIINSTGQVVYENMNLNSEQYHVDLTSISKGEYFVKTIFDTKEVINKIVLE